jgi:hypothetical protein
MAISESGLDMSVCGFGEVGPTAPRAIAEGWWSTFEQFRTPGMVNTFRIPSWSVVFAAASVCSSFS